MSQITAKNNTNKNIVLAVTASIAIFRSCELIRSLRKEHHSVRVIMTENATRFISKMNFSVLSEQRAYSSEWEEGMVHIDTKNAMDLYVVCPITANCIGKFANGIADDIVSSTYLAAQCPVLIVPAMNPQMYQAAAVQRNIEQLRCDGVHILSPQTAEVICGDYGQGKIAENTEILKKIHEIISHK